MATAIPAVQSGGPDVGHRELSRPIRRVFVERNRSASRCRIPDSIRDVRPASRVSSRGNEGPIRPRRRTAPRMGDAARRHVVPTRIPRKSSWGTLRLSAGYLTTSARGFCLADVMLAPLGPWLSPAVNPNQIFGTIQSFPRTAKNR